MNTKHYLTLATLTTLTTQGLAVTIIEPYDNSSDGGVTDTAFPYLARATFAAVDSYRTSVMPGAWSFSDLDPTKNQDRGWGHATRWFLIELTENTAFSLTMTTNSAAAQPGFVIYTGESLNDSPDDLHTYSNNGSSLALNDPWNTSGDLTYLGNAFAGNTTSLSETFQLSAGLYTVGFGNAADSTTSPQAIPYQVSFTAVPETSGLLLTSLGSLLMLRRRRR